MSRPAGDVSSGGDQALPRREASGEFPFHALRRIIVTSCRRLCKDMQLDRIIPFGRSFDEYRLMFGLTENDHPRRILGVGDGPASFNAEATRLGWNVTSVDPLYQFSAVDIEARFRAVVDDVIAQINATPDHWSWTYHQDPTSLRASRSRTTAEFCADFPAGLREGRYVVGELPSLPFAPGLFDLALCSHLLFLYSDLLDLEFHVRALTEMLRVAREVRVFPLVSLDLSRSRHLDAVVGHFKALKCDVSIAPVAYELQRGGNQMLIFRSSTS
jgi:SAM-dependent methyltransferase